MLWFVVLFYVVLSPVACLLIGRAIRVREVERPVELPQPAETATAPADVVPAPAAAVVPAPRPVPTGIDLGSIRAFTGGTPRALRPRWQQGALRTLGL